MGPVFRQTTHAGTLGPLQLPKARPQDVGCWTQLLCRDALEGGEVTPPPPLQGAQPMPGHCLPDAKCQGGVFALRATFRLYSPRRVPKHTPWKRP